MKKEDLINILTKDIYLPKADFVEIQDYIFDYVNNTKEYYLIPKKQTEEEILLDLHSISSNLTLFSLEILKHSDKLWLFRVLDKNNTIVNMIAGVKKEFMLKILNAAEAINNCINQYTLYIKETRKLYASEKGEKIHLDLQESGYMISNEEATQIKNILQKIAATKGIDFTELQDVNFKLNFEAWLPKPNN